MSLHSRRSILHASLLAAGGAALAACTSEPANPGSPGSTVGSSPGSVPVGGTTSTTATPGPVGSVTDGVLTLFTDQTINYEQIYGAGAAGYGAADIGEVVTAAGQAGAGASIPDAVGAYQAMSDRVAGDAEAALDAEHRVTARDKYLRAAEYLTGPLFFILGTEEPGREPAVFGSLKERWGRAAALFDPMIEKVAIPYETSSLVGYWLPALGGGPARRPTVIVNNGSDGQSVETYSWGGRAAQERGWNALLLEGPGQGELLFEREIPMRPDWENVITPVVDWLVARPDVDPERIALTGWSMGGVLTSRAAAFESRLRALVTDPGCVDAYLAFPEVLRTVADAGDAEEVNKIWANEIIPGSTPEQAYSLKKRLEIFTVDALRQARAGEVPTDWYGLSREIQRYRSDDVAARITARTLVVGYEGEQFYPGQDQQLFDLLTAEKDHVVLGSSDGAQLHCAPMAPRVRNEVVYDWLDEAVR